MSKVIKCDGVEYKTIKYNEHDKSHITNVQCEDCCFFDGCISCNAPLKIKDFCHDIFPAQKVYWEKKK